jgi:hypothetical protein
MLFISLGISIIPKGLVAVVSILTLTIENKKLFKKFFHVA